MRFALKYFFFALDFTGSFFFLFLYH